MAMVVLLLLLLLFCRAVVPQQQQQQRRLEQVVYVPGKSVIVQWGKARTATTAQWSILCFMARLRNFKAGVDPPLCDLVSKNEAAETLEHGVYKTHYFENVENALSKVDPSLVMIFETSDRGDSQVRKNRKVLYLQDYEQMQRCPLGTVRDYAAAFNLTKDEEMRSRAHFKFYDIYRLCCGDQAAISWRLRLHGCPPVFAFYDDRQPNCELYDLKAVEARWKESENFDSPAFNDLHFPPSFQSTCAKENDDVSRGKEFADHKFTNCLDLARKWVKDKDVIRAYKCRNYNGPCD